MYIVRTLQPFPQCQCMYMHEIVCAPCSGSGILVLVTLIILSFFRAINSGHSHMKHYKTLHWAVRFWFAKPPRACSIVHIIHSEYVAFYVSIYFSATPRWPNHGTSYVQRIECMHAWRTASWCGRKTIGSASDQIYTYNMFLYVRISERKMATSLCSEIDFLFGHIAFPVRWNSGTLRIRVANKNGIADVCYIMQ